ncbi:AcrR family transcriptional regulator [Kibdelosporangium banguiense]|uniref:AcrR family transcriptional regulator n=1 Tax=Kibdelosporangium banguiense TaxID=1365924 RepID=A0ABS4TK47_9PSEU|nr:TetR/AcrR family transcriptional regulator [Kibdelosporangium banguiense]MBP2324780.1 AcrR family transcriptional regulator [Kibdelosporangium banguiense]
MRADARRNRDKLLEAARKAFATEGLSVPVDEIARRAGVGAGTMHRHFPTKESLLEAIVVSHVEVLVEEARVLDDTDDPGAAFFGFCFGMVERGMANRALAEVLAGVGFDAQARIAAVAEQLEQAIERLVERAQAAGAVRSDIGMAEIHVLLNSVHFASERANGDAEMAMRVMAVVCDGLRVAT